MEPKLKKCLQFFLRPKVVSASVVFDNWLRVVYAC